MTEQLTGVELIAAERQRQISEEGWTPEHDEQHDAGELVMAACAYASYAVEVRLYRRVILTNEIRFVDPFPKEWRDKRKSKLGDTYQSFETLSSTDRIDLLTKAGALIAAEIDRLQRSEQDA